MGELGSHNEGKEMNEEQEKRFDDLFKEVPIVPGKITDYKAILGQPKDYQEAIQEQRKILGQLAHLRIDLRQSQKGFNVQISKELAEHLLDVYDKLIFLTNQKDKLKKLIASLNEIDEFL